MEESPPDPGTASRSGTASRHPGALPEALLRYLEARGVLLSIEGQEVARSLVRVVLLGVLAAIFGFTGWLLLMAGLAVYFAVERGWSWVHVTGGLGLVNLILGIAFALAASRRMGATRWFEHTLAEFGKDRAWLGQLNDKH